MTSGKLVSAATQTVRVGLDTEQGMLCELTFFDQGRHLSPLHRAPWRDDPTIQANLSIPVVERRLCGDFFCAPFGASDIEGGPAHGPTANEEWTLEAATPDSLSFQSNTRAMGARFRKIITLSTNAPLLYQEHQIIGGTGGLSAAHHPMVQIATTGRFCTSPKSMAIAADPPLEPGRNRLVANERSGDLTRFPGTDGLAVDLTRLPIGTAHEDFIALVEMQDRDMAWSAVIRDSEDDIVFFLKNPHVLPLTMLWHSNGGRDHAPWNGRHRGVLGIEDGRAAGVAGHRAAISDNVFTRLGVPTAFDLTPGREHTIRHVIGAVGRPPGWDEVTDIIADGASLTLVGSGDAHISMPFRAGFLAHEA